jgi:hypothetical protein
LCAELIGKKSFAFLKEGLGKRLIVLWLLLLSLFRRQHVNTEKGESREEKKDEQWSLLFSLFSMHSV